MKNPIEELNVFMHNEYAPDHKTSELILSKTNTLRRLIGILGVLTPFMLILGLGIAIGFFYPLDSISHYYFTRVSGIFIIVVSLMAFFLMIYKGHEPLDFWLSFIAGVAALVMIMFPTSNIVVDEPTHEAAVTFLSEDDGFRKTLHYISAGIFLLALAMMSIFLFTKTNHPDHLKKGSPHYNPQKVKRNRLFRFCGLAMVACIIVVFSCGFLMNDKFPNYDKYNITFWMECLALWSFGTAWLVKGGMGMKDKS